MRFAPLPSLPFLNGFFTHQRRCKQLSSVSDLFWTGSDLGCHTKFRSTSHVSAACSPCHGATPCPPHSQPRHITTGTGSLHPKCPLLQQQDFHLDRVVRRAFGDLPWTQPSLLGQPPGAAGQVRLQVHQPGCAHTTLFIGIWVSCCCLCSHVYSARQNMEPP